MDSKTRAAIAFLRKLAADLEAHPPEYPYEILETEDSILLPRPRRLPPEAPLGPTASLPQPQSRDYSESEVEQGGPAEPRFTSDDQTPTTVAPSGQQLVHTCPLCDGYIRIPDAMRRRIEHDQLFYWQTAQSLPSDCSLCSGTGRVDPGVKARAKQHQIDFWRNGLTPDRRR